MAVVAPGLALSLAAATPAAAWTASSASATSVEAGVRVTRGPARADGGLDASLAGGRTASAPAAPAAPASATAAAPSITVVVVPLFRPRGIRTHTMGKLYYDRAPVVRGARYGGLRYGQ